MPEPERHVLPDDFEGLRPVLFKAAITSSVDLSRLNGYDAVRLMKAEKDLASHFEAGSLATMAEAAHSPGAGRSLVSSETSRRWSKQPMRSRPLSVSPGVPPSEISIWL